MLWIPKGANPAGIVGSVKVLTKLKLLSNTSTVPKRKSVAYRNFPAGVVTNARPLYTAPTSPAWSVAVERSTAMMAWVGSTLGFQPTMVPSSVAKRNLLGPDVPASDTTKPSAVGLSTAPVGAPTAPGPAEGGAGMATTCWPLGPVARSEERRVG